MCERRGGLTLADLAASSGSKKGSNQGAVMCYDPRSKPYDPNRARVPAKRFSLQIRALFNKVSALYQENWNVDTRYYLNTQCSRCGVNPAPDPNMDPWIFLTLVPEMAHGEHENLVNFLHQCKNCSAEMTIRILLETMKPYIGVDLNFPIAYPYSQHPKWGEVLQFETRGVDILDYDIRGQWRAQSSISQLQFFVDFKTREEWTGWDPQAHQYVNIYNVDVRVMEMRP